MRSLVTRTALRTPIVRAQPFARLSAIRCISSYNGNGSSGSGSTASKKLNALPYYLAGGAALTLFVIDNAMAEGDKKAAAPAAAAGGAVDYNAVRAAIVKILDKEDYDDGSLGPVFVRLAWHASGTYDKHSRTGGSNGATMRFEPESKDGANAGLDKARAFLEPIKKQFPGISYADLWTLAASVAIEEMGGPKIDWRAGRSDAPDGRSCPAVGRLPDASKAADHIRDVFYRMGLNDQEIVALIGAHCLGRAHTDRSGFTGPWTRAPTTFSNEFFRELLQNKWTEKKWNGPKQYTDPTGELLMLPADLAFIQDAKFKVHVEAYAANQQKFFKDFAVAWKKLIEFNVPAFAEKASAPTTAAPAAPAKPAEKKDDKPKDGAKPAEKSWWQKLFG